LTAILFLFPAHAAEPAPWVCDDAPNNAVHIQCADREFRKHDAELNKIYRQLLVQADNELEPGYGPPPRAALEQAQRAWLTFRDADCHWNATAFYGGTQQSVLRISCLAVATRDRVEELRARLN
jgi:uncharacterized protein YecT (DUF1311 family)